MAIQPEEPSHSLLMDAVLYCEEERWVDEEDEEEQREEDDNFLQYSSSSSNNTINGAYKCAKEREREREERQSSFLYPPTSSNSLIEHDDEGLASLFSKEQEQHRSSSRVLGLSETRKGAVDWMLKVIARCGFSALTGILGLNYLDRFLVTFSYRKDQPWMIQIAAVACLSLATKVQETQAPLLLELQEVVESEYMFKAKDVQSMELLVLSTLKWKMHPVTPLSFVDHIVRRLLRLRSHNFHWEFLRRCERLLLSLLSDSRSVVYLPSVLATATMMHVIDQVEPFHSLEYQNQLLGVLEITKDEVNGCYELIQETTGNDQPQCKSLAGDRSSLKRKYDQLQLPATARSPSGVIDAVLGCDSSNDSWALGREEDGSPSVPIPVLPPHEKLEQKHQPPPPLFKRSRTQDTNGCLWI